LRAFFDDARVRPQALLLPSDLAMMPLSRSRIALDISPPTLNAACLVRRSTMPDLDRAARPDEIAAMGERPLERLNAELVCDAEPNQCWGGRRILSRPIDRWLCAKSPQGNHS
jgi:hypothetical protein